MSGGGGLALGCGLAVPVAVFLLALAAPLAVPLVVSTGLAAQVDLSGAESRYEDALTDYNDRLTELQRIFLLHEQSLGEVDAARRSGDAARQDRAFATFQSRVFGLHQIERETSRAADHLRAARRNLLLALENRELEILDQLDAEADPLRRESLLAEWERVRRRTLQVEPEVGLEEEFALQPVPELTIDPRDGPTELREKAGFMEDWAAAYDSTVIRLDDEIAERERRALQLRTREDLMADLSRFDADLLPGGRLGTRPAPGGSGDDGGDGAGGSGLAQLSLSEQVEVLRWFRAQAIQYRDLALERAETFRARAEGRIP